LLLAIQASAVTFYVLLKCAILQPGIATFRKVITAKRYLSEEVRMADTSNRGFAAMSKEKQREIASKGGKASRGSGSRSSSSSSSRTSGAAGPTEAASRGGKNSSRS
jgi:general stress protein YciG